jgi:prevent-host-death family protein
MVSRISITNARQRWSDLLNRVAYGGERVILESWGRPKAAIISMADFERFLELEEAATEGQASGGQR